MLEFSRIRTGCHVIIHLLASLAVLVLYIPRSDPQQQAAALAYDWWKTYRFGGGCDKGEAWIQTIKNGVALTEEDGEPECFVGKSVTIGGGFNNTDASYHRAWFGHGKTWDLAFKDAISRGYPPLGADGEPDSQKEAAYLGK
jgi:hypothetical protein